jgi:hypothetical protein
MHGSQRAVAGAACGLAAVLLLATAGPPAAGPGGFVVRGARVFDGTRMLGIADVLVSGGKIAAVGGDLSVPPGTEVVAGAGRTLLPGLIDAHAHSIGDTLRDALVFGVTTELAAGGFFAWAGASLSPGAAPFAVVDLSARKGLRFWARGDGRGYQVMVFSQSHGRMPLSQSFTAGPAWKELAFPWSSFSGYDGHDVTAVVFAALLPPGPFAFRLAGVRLE